MQQAAVAESAAGAAADAAVDDAAAAAVISCLCPCWCNLLFLLGLLHEEQGQLIPQQVQA